MKWVVYVPMFAVGIAAWTPLWWAIWEGFRGKDRADFYGAIALSLLVGWTVLLMCVGRWTL